MAQKRKFRWTAARRSAFGKMQRARKRLTNGKRRRTVRRRRNPTAILANPYVPRGSFYGPAFGEDFALRAPRKTRADKGQKRRKKRKYMAKRKAGRPKGSKNKRKSKAKRTYRRRRPRAIARVSAGKARTIYINPRRRRSRRRRRSNPGMKGLFMRFLIPYAAGFGTSFLAAGLDSKLAKYPMVNTLVKVGGALVLAGAFGRKYPIIASSAIASLAASSGYTFGTKAFGGMVAHDVKQVITGAQLMAEKDPAVGALLRGGVGALLRGYNGTGALLSGPPDLTDVTANYESALRNMPDDD